ncbi:hypothetical protein HK100_005922, partial [Physocladia obscura]
MSGKGSERERGPASSAANIAMAETKQFSFLIPTATAKPPTDTHSAVSTAAAGTVAAPTAVSKSKSPRKKACDRCRLKHCKCEHAVEFGSYSKTNIHSASYPRINKPKQTSAQNIRSALPLKNISNPASHLVIIRPPPSVVVDYTPAIENMQIEANASAMLSDGQVVLPKDASSELIEKSVQNSVLKYFVDPKAICDNIETESQLLLNASYAFGAKDAKHPIISKIGRTLGGPALSDSEAKQVAAEDFFKKALDITCMRTNDLTASEIAGLVMLHLYCTASGQFARASKFLRMAVNYLGEFSNSTNSNDFEFKDGKVIPAKKNDSTLTRLEHEQLRRLWWTCYVMDRFFSAVSGEPMI